MKNFYFLICFALSSIYGSIPLKFKDQYEYAKQLKYPSSELPQLLWNIARIYYENEDWDEFFGVASYLRNGYPNEVETEKIRLLELLALFRHCQVDLIKESVKESLEHSKSHRDVLLSINEILKSGSGSEVLPLKNGKPKNDSLYLGRNAWKIHQKDLHLYHFLNIKRHIHPHCKKGSQP